MTDASDLADKLAALKFQAEDGNAEAMFLLGVAYAQGKGTERNDTLAARWFQQAARSGNARARTSMGYLHSIGRGVRHDVIMAFVLLSQAVDQGDPLAQDMLVRLRRQMNTAQVIEAQRRLRERTPV